ncbi:MAG: hypothetical protein GTO24_21170 [candidate division Zixibacteria bacterium]|nr:hypothetical protein [candidate division Zixibacteria bacterium]
MTEAPKPYPKTYKERTMEEIQEALAEPTPENLIEWLPTDIRKHNGHYSALALAYTDARFFQNRLDEVVGSFNWQSKAEVVSNLLLVGIAIRHPQTDEWIWKWDTGQAGEDGSRGFGGGKGLFSQGFKRAGYQWGIARDLYALPTPRCSCKGYSKNNKNYFRGWVENPWEKAESPETGRLHRSQVERKKTPDPEKIEEEGEVEAAVDFIPATSTTYYTLAFNKLDLDRDQAREALQPHIDKETGEIDYAKAIMVLEKNLHPDDRDFTIQQQEIAQLEKEGESA